VRKPTVRFAGSAASPAQFPKDTLPEVAFLGRSNVGKSRLLNALLGTPGLARVSSTPGRTQLVNFFRVDDSWYMVDLPGYGYARVPQAVRRGFEALVTAYLEREAVALGVFLVDPRRPPTEEDDLLRRYLDGLRLPYVVAATKADRLGGNELRSRLRELARGVGRKALEVIATSAEDGTGLPELLRTIRRAIEAHGTARTVAVGREA
jgi:GTP-binding protein